MKSIYPFLKSGGLSAKEMKDFFPRKDPFFNM
jgi:hypothetical protein